MKKLASITLLAAVAALVQPSFAANEVAAYWQIAGKSWGQFSDPNNWKIGDASTGETGVPGAGNYIWITPTKGQSTPLYFDLGGGTHTVGGVSALNTTKNDSTNGRATSLAVTNGTLTLKGNVSGMLSYEICSDATLVSYADINRYWGAGDYQRVHVYPGARFEERGKLVFQGYKATVDEGGTYVHDVSAFGVFYKNSNQDNGLTNRGRFEAPNGITVTYTTDVEKGRKDGKTIYRNEGNGVFLLGGNVQSTTQTTQTYDYEFVGGTLEASNTVAFVGFRDIDRLYFDNAVTVKVDADSSLSLAGFTYGENATLTKTGPGKLTLGENAIPSLAVSAGSVELNEGAALPTTISFASGSTLLLNTPAIGLNPSSYQGMAITVDASLIVGGQTLIQSDNAAFLSYAAAKINSGLSGNLGAVVHGDKLIVAKKGDHMFDASVSFDLTNAAAWGGTLPTADDDVIISSGTANYPAGSVKFKSILLQVGATLSVSGGTAETPVDLPPIELDNEAKLLIADVAQLTNTFTTVGDANVLPVLEVATNATLIVQSPDHPVVRCSHDKWSYKGPDYGFRIKNVQLNWYGTIQMAEKDLGDIEKTGTYRHARLTIGYAAADETSYIALDCQGGTYLAAAEGNSAGRCLSALVIATPDNGGTVIPVGTMLLRDYTHAYQTPTVAKNPSCAHPGLFIGKCSEWWTGNPASVTYDVVIDGETDLSVKGNCSIAGGAHVYLRGPAQWRYVRTAANDENLLRSIKLYDEATLTVENGAYLDICTSEHETYRGLQVTGTTEDQRVFTAKDAKLSLLNWSGSGKNTALVDNSLLEIGYLRSASTRGLIDAVFDGFKSVEIANSFTIAAAAVDRGNPSKAAVTNNEIWDRFVKIGPPLTGSGSLLVSNELAVAQVDYYMTVVVTNGANTATGMARTVPTATGAPAQLLFADGANWAGTVVADDTVGLTNLTDGAAAATANFRAMSGVMPIRVWKTGGAIAANDKVNLTVAGGAFKLVAMDEELAVNDTVELGLYPEDAALPQAGDGISYSAAPSSVAGFVTLKASVAKRGTIFMLAGPESPKMRLGVLSDIHISLDDKGDVEQDALDRFEAALRYFDGQKVDAVIIAGDMANTGNPLELNAVGQTWNKVFPNGVASDGRAVEKIFICGNHELNGAIADDYETAWMNAFGETYAPVYVKRVKGYDFVAAHWGHEGEAAAAIVGAGRKGGLFFHIQHPHVTGTVYGGGGPEAVADAFAPLSQYPLAVSFSGHTHTRLQHEQSVWQNEFTALGTASLSYLTSNLPCTDVFPRGYENDTAASGITVTDKLMYNEHFDSDHGQGYLVTVYSDRVIFSRREFTDAASGTQVGDDWILPLDGTKPLSLAARAAKSAAPQFPADATLTITRTTFRSVDAFRLDFPAAEGVYEYRIVGTCANSQTVESRVRATSQTIFLAASRFGDGSVTFEVTPYNSLDVSGTALSATAE